MCDVKVSLTFTSMSLVQMKRTFQEIRIIATGPCIMNQLRDVNTICRRSWYIAAHIWKIYKIFFFLSMCDVKVFLTFTSLSLALIWQLFYLFCSSIVVNTVIVTAGNFKHIRMETSVLSFIDHRTRNWSVPL
jgi:hypothetical protein